MEKQVKNIESHMQKETQLKVQSVPDRPDHKSYIDPFDTTLLGTGVPNYVVDPSCLKNLPPIATEDEIKVMNSFYEKHFTSDEKKSEEASSHEAVKTDKNSTWIQTFSGRRFNPIDPNENAICIQDIAHALSMQCRFSGHCKKFYSVAQHSVLVSYICDSKDALWGLLHDGSEAYLVDVPSPLKKSGKFGAYIEFEKNMQQAICRRFNLPLEEPESVKKADSALLATEARDLMTPLHSDWVQPTNPLPFLIEPWDHEKAENMFVKRFYELIGADESCYDHYLARKNHP